MAKSLAKIQEQIARLQKEADSIQSSVIARLRKEIAQYGLTADHLFGSSVGAPTNSSAKEPAVKKATTSKSGVSRPTKYADPSGNTWSGIGKRPQWIRDALNAGQALVDFLVPSKKTPATPKASAKTPAKATKTVVAKKAAPKTSSAKAMPAKKKAKTPAAAKPAAKASAKTPAKKVPKAAAVKKTAAKKPKATPAAKTPQTAA